MSSAKRMGSGFSGARRPGLIAGLAISALAGGCSADVSRFDFPSSVALNEPTGAIATPQPVTPDRSNLGADGSSGQAYFPPQDRSNEVQMSAIPEASTPPPAAPQQPVTYAAPAPAPAAPAPAPAQSTANDYGASTGRGEQIEVRQGDTLYGLSKRHRVALTELMAVNDLKTPNLKPGQKLFLPSGKTAAISTEPARPAEPAPPVATAEAPADWTGSYVMRPGDSLYAVARRHNVKPAELQAYNGITDVRRLRPGTVLKMPAGAGTQVAANSASPTQTDAAPITAATPAPQSPPAAVPSPASGEPSAQPTLINGQQTSAEANGKQTVAMNTPTAATDTGKLRWPAQGKVIANFGQRPDGTHNDGINVAVPMGTEVHAADAGVVAYAGNELKGYGNLILLRHDNGWVTAYAHSEDLLVKRGDKVKRGQVIAKAGKTGQVDQPQVHFELRQGQRPVDPIPYMEKL